MIRANGTLQTYYNDVWLAQRKVDHETLQETAPGLFRGGRMVDAPASGMAEHRSGSG